LEVSFALNSSVSFSLLSKRIVQKQSQIVFHSPSTTPQSCTKSASQDGEKNGYKKLGWDSKSDNSCHWNYIFWGLKNEAIYDGRIGKEDGGKGED
jgi:hypothetical protein